MMKSEIAVSFAVGRCSCRKQIVVVGATPIEVV